MEPLEIGNVTIYPFGIVLALALGACVIWSLLRCAGPRMRKTQEIFWLIAIPLGLILAHLGYALCNLDMIEDEFVEVLQAAPTPQIFRVVDHGLDAQRAPVLQILLDEFNFVIFRNFHHFESGLH